MKRRSKFNLSYDRLYSMNGGYITPIGITEVLPGDSFRHSVSSFIRVSPLVSPVMHPVHCKVHHWYVPTRLLWENFEEFITGGPDGLNADEPPYLNLTDGVTTGSLGDYLGIPAGIPNLQVSALPFRAYNLIYNEWYRDGTLQEEKPISLDSGLDTTTSLELLRADWEKDYFTTARPQPQLGPSVLVPLIGEGQAFSIQSDGSAPTFKDGTIFNAGVFDGLWGTQDHNLTSNTYGPTLIKESYLNSYIANTGAFNRNYPGVQNDVGGGLSTQSTVSFSAPGNAINGNLLVTPYVFDNPGLKVVTTGSGGVGTTVNALREAFAIERFMEHRSLFGARYSEYLRYLGIKPSDARLQRPEYLGGGKQTIQFSEVLQTAEGTNPVGSMAGHGIAAFKSNSYRRFFEEHGYVISVMIIRPIAIYAQGLPRLWSRKVKEDYWQQELENIGEQEVLNKELYAAHSEPDGTFGYQARYQEYRGHESNIAGEFRNVLDYWHMARIFDNSPALNSDFLTCVPTNRVFASQETDQYYCMAHHSLVARRLLRRY